MDQDLSARSRMSVCFSDKNAKNPKRGEGIMWSVETPFRFDFLSKQCRDRSTEVHNLRALKFSH